MRRASTSTTARMSTARLIRTGERPFFPIAMVVSSVRRLVPVAWLAAVLGACASGAEPTAPATVSTSVAPGGTTSAGQTQAAPLPDRGVSGTVGAIDVVSPPVPTTCATRTAGFFAGMTLTAASETRHYDLFVPDRTDLTAPLPVVLVFHADDGQSLRAVLGLEAVTGTHAIVVYPYGNGNAWNLSKPDGNDDYAFVDALKASLVASQCADAKRMFAYGFSNGGYFVNQMACYRGTAAFRGIAVNSSGLYAPDGAPESYDDNGDLLCPAPPPAALVIHGTADTVSDYQHEGVYTEKSWRHADTCGASSTAMSPAPCVTYSGCTANPVAFCGISGMGHQVWSSAATATWGFFSQL